MMQPSLGGKIMTDPSEENSATYTIILTRIEELPIPRAATYSIIFMFYVVK